MRDTDQLSSIDLCVSALIVDQCHIEVCILRHIFAFQFEQMIETDILK